MGDAVNVKSADNHNVATSFLMGTGTLIVLIVEKDWGKGKGREGKGREEKEKEHLLLQFW